MVMGQPDCLTNLAGRTPVGALHRELIGGNGRLLFRASWGCIIQFTQYGLTGMGGWDIDTEATVIIVMVLFWGVVEEVLGEVTGVENLCKVRS